MKKKVEGWIAYLRAISPLDVELVLKHDKITLALLVLHESLELSTESVEQVGAARSDLIVGEEADPAQARDDTVSLGLVREVGDRLDLGDQRARQIYISAPCFSSDSNRRSHLWSLLEAPMAFWVSSFQDKGAAPSFNHSFSSAFKKPISTRVLMNSGKP